LAKDLGFQKKFETRGLSGKHLVRTPATKATEKEEQIAERGVAAEPATYTRKRRHRTTPQGSSKARSWLEWIIQGPALKSLG